MQLQCKSVGYLYKGPRQLSCLQEKTALNQIEAVLVHNLLYIKFRKQERESSYGSQYSNTRPASEYGSAHVLLAYCRVWIHIFASSHPSP